MPFTSEKIKIEKSQYDRRIKLTEEDKAFIRWLRETHNESYNSIAKRFGVSKRLIGFVLNPDSQQKAKEYLKKAKKDGKYKPTKEEWRETIKEHRRYKQKLYTEGKIKKQV